MRRAYYGHFYDLRDFGYHILNFPSADSVTTRFDHFTFAFDEIDKTILVHPCQIAGVKLAVFPLGKRYGLELLVSLGMDALSITAQAGERRFRQYLDVVNFVVYGDRIL